MLAEVVSGAVLSVSKVDFLTYDDVLKDRAWVIYATLDGQDPTIVGTFSSDELNSRRIPTIGEKVKYDFTLSMSLDEFTCEYPILAQDEYIWNYNFEKKLCPFHLGGKEFWEECEDKHPDWAMANSGHCWWGYWGYPPSLSQICPYYCVWRTEKARYGRVLDPRTHFRATITLTSHGDTKTGVINSHNAKSVVLDNIAYIRWVGNLGTDEECPTAQAVGISAMYYGGRWLLTDYDKWDSYKAYSFESCFRDVLSGVKEIDECIEEHDTLAGKALYEKRFSFYLSDISERATAKVEGGKVVMNIPKLLKSPTFILKIKADWLGVVLPSGIPKITGVDAKPIRTGTEGRITIKIKNIGRGAGSFDTAVVCDSPFSVIESPPTISIPAGETREVFVRVYADCAEEIQRVCRVTVVNSEDVTKKDTTSLSILCKPIVTCLIEGEKRCNGDILEVCSGGKWTYVTTCKYGCAIINGEPKCKKPSSVCGNGVCELGENVLNCPQDCRTSVCGNGVCEPGENNINCPQDCKHPCDIECPFGDINCYNKIINCWINEIIRSVKLTLIVVGAVAIIGIILYMVSQRKKEEKEK